VRIALIVAGSVVALASCGGPARVDPDAHDRTAVLAAVSDGDTLELSDGTRVRLIGIDTPETQHPEFGDECYGHAATGFTESLLEPGDEVRLVLDVETRDRYDRLLAYVYRASDNLFVNAEIVRRGYAYVSTIPPNVEHAEQFRRLAAEAREENRGLWSKCEVQGAVGGERPGPSSDGPCLPGYEGACVPPPPPDYDCADFDGPITVTGDDPHSLDSDGDGIACASSE
jgi:micrococcal nuclease